MAIKLSLCLPALFTQSCLHGLDLLVPIPSACPNSIHTAKPELKCYLYCEASQYLFSEKNLLQH